MNTIEGTLQPKGNRVVVREDAAEEKRGQIHIPESAQEKPTEGVVVAVGPGNTSDATGERLPMTLEVGDRVLYDQWSGVLVETEDGPLLVVREDHIMAVLEPAA